ncbi:protein kinase PAK 3 [Seminavis robusta]|uniref:Protein kinase PAK 3 n=1 Tax=Seminavis robusta TaxID=568900 RepID=A0A9N8DFM5_9STRA|nr:protein kinase PAK 3 [Seminavis robusta]|eukprot:Sro127_g060750.1 protein kinase PAK 3 (621) ;mRNA; r:19399-21261
MVFPQRGSAALALLVTFVLATASLVSAFSNQARLTDYSFLKYEEKLGPRHHVPAHSRGFEMRLYAPSVLDGRPAAAGARSTRRSVSSLSAIPEIERWRILEGGSVQGFVKNHPVIKNGDIITTSALKAPNAVGSQMIVTTSSGTKYKLLEPLKKDNKKGTFTMNKRFSAKKSPSVKLSGNVPLVDDWKLLDNDSVQGIVFNHPTIPDGQILVTSTLKNPKGANSKAVVNTVSGSRYRLGQPEFAAEVANSGPAAAPAKPAEAKKSSGFSFFGGGAPKKTTAPPPPTRASTPNGAAAPAKPAAEDEKELRQRRVQAQRTYGLSGETLGENGQYLLAGQPMKSTSGKSLIFRAYRGDDNGLPIGDVDTDAITIKISTNSESIEREAGNYRAIAQSGFTRGQFVQFLEYLPGDKLNSSMGRSKSQSALVIERGEEDLKTYLARRRDEGGLSGKELREAAAAAIQCIQAAHSSGLVWTDMKTENFVVTRAGEFKGIDLESAMPINGNPVDYSPEACPPEFAQAFLAGEGPYFTLQPNYDMWSFGMMCYEMATGAGYFDNKSPIQITRALSNMESFEVPDDVELDGRMKSLIEDCLQVDPKKRPSTAQVLLHPYFLTTGFGPFSF